MTSLLLTAARVRRDVGAPALPRLLELALHADIIDPLPHHRARHTLLVADQV